MEEGFENFLEKVKHDTEIKARYFGMYIGLVNAFDVKLHRKGKLNGISRGLYTIPERREYVVQAESFGVPLSESVLILKDPCKITSKDSIDIFNLDKVTISRDEVCKWTIEPDYNFGLAAWHALAKKGYAIPVAGRLTPFELGWGVETAKLYKLKKYQL